MTLERYHILPRPILPLTLTYSTIVTLSSGYLYLFSSYAPQIIDRLQLGPVEAGVLTISLSVGSAIGGIPTGVLIDSWGTEIATAVGGILTMASYLTLRHCYLHNIDNMAILSLAVCTSGFASIVGNYSAMKCSTTNFPNNKGAACGLVASGFALSALVLSAIAGKLFKNDVPGLLLFLALFNGTVIFFGFFFVREIASKFEDYLVVGDEEDNNNASDYEPLRSPIDPEATTGTSSLMNSLERSSNDNYLATLKDDSEDFHRNYSSRGSTSNNENEDEANTSKKSSEVHETIIHYRNNNFPESEISSALINAGHQETLWDKVMLKISNFKENSLLCKIFTSRLFFLSYLSLTFLTSIGQTYIFSVGYIVQTQYANKNYHYDVSQHSLQNLQVSVFSFCNFIGRFSAGLLSDLIVSKLQLQRVWVINISIVLLFIAQVILVHLNNLNHLVIVSLLSGIAFGIVFGTFPSIISDYYDSKIYSTIWGTITTGPFFCNTLLSHYFAKTIEQNGEYDDESQKFVCYKGNDCYKSTFYLTELFCGLALVSILYTIWYKKNVLKERVYH